MVYTEKEEKESEKRLRALIEERNLFTRVKKSDADRAPSKCNKTERRQTNPIRCSQVCTCLSERKDFPGKERRSRPRKKKECRSAFLEKKNSHQTKQRIR